MDDDTAAYTLPVGTIVWPQGFLLLLRQRTHLSLGDRSDSISQVIAVGVTADCMGYGRAVPNDRAVCRTIDSGGSWSRDCHATPGDGNRLFPPHEPGNPRPAGRVDNPEPVTDIAAARALSLDTRVTVIGAVTLSPGAFGRSIHIQDETGGIRVYLPATDFPPLELGAILLVTGWTRDDYGDLELSVPDAG